MSSISSRYLTRSRVIVDYVSRCGRGAAIQEVLAMRRWTLSLVIAVVAAALTALPVLADGGIVSP